MNDSEQPFSEQSGKQPERLHDTAGMMLRKARESANLSQAVVGEALHLTVHYIKALENDDHSKLPGATFVKGYLRVYARYLKLDVNAVLASYEKSNASAEALNNKTELSSRNQKRHDQTFKWAVVTAIIVVLGVVAGWWFVGKDQTTASGDTATLQAPSLQQQDRPASTTASPVGRSADNSTGFPSRLAASPAVSTIISDTVDARGDLSSSDTLLDAQRHNATADVAAIVTNESSDPGHDSNFGSTTVSPEGGSARVNVLTSSRIAQMQGGDDLHADGSSATLPSGTSVAVPGQQDTSLTITPKANGGRQIALTSTGSDLLHLNLKGSSWIEIDDHAKGRLFNNTLNEGDAMTLRATAPFKILLGDATQIELSFNSQPVNLASHIRNDKTARFSVDIPTPAVHIAGPAQGATP